MLGAMVGDIVGSRFEGQKSVEPDFMLFSTQSRFTDDSVLTAAVAEALLEGKPYAEAIRAYAREYPNAGYGARFMDWAFSTATGPYGSMGNGSAMRVSPVGWFFDDLDQVLEHAALSSSVTHDHPEGVKGARAVAAAVYLARTGNSKDHIRDFVRGHMGYDLDMDMKTARKTGSSVLAPDSVPQALTAFLHAEDFVDAVRKAVSIGGDTDTVAAMAGAVAEAFFGPVPDYVAAEAFTRMDDRLAGVVRRFQARCGPKPPP